MVVYSPGKAKRALLELQLHPEINLACSRSSLHPAKCIPLVCSVGLFFIYMFFFSNAVNSFLGPVSYRWDYYRSGLVLREPVPYEVRSALSAHPDFVLSNNFFLFGAFSV
jgi:hypothetical protein